MMDWINGSRTPPLVHRPENPLTFLYNCNYDHYPGVETKYPMMEKSIRNYPRMSEAERKKRLTDEQLESLEKSFMEDQKLEPDRKIKLARQLGLQSRQIAVWFQNRRARWKAKELERSYNALKLEYDAVFQEKKRLQEEVSALKTMLAGRVNKNHQVSTGHTDRSGEEMMESTSMENPCATEWPPGEAMRDSSHQNNVDQPMYNLSGDEYNPVPSMPSYWNTVLPSYL